MTIVIPNLLKQKIIQTN